MPRQKNTTTAPRTPSGKTTVSYNLHLWKVHLLFSSTTKIFTFEGLLLFSDLNLFGFDYLFNTTSFLCHFLYPVKVVRQKIPLAQYEDVVGDNLINLAVVVEDTASQERVLSSEEFNITSPQLIIQVLYKNSQYFLLKVSHIQTYCIHQLKLL